MNNTYYLYLSNYTEDVWCETLIIDEAHLIEHSLMSFIETIITKREMARLNLPYPKKGEKINIYFPETLRKAKFKRDMLIIKLKSFSKLDREIAMNDINIYNSLINKFEFVVEHFTPEKWVIDRQYDKIIIKPIKVNEYIGKYVVKDAHKVILMSATITPALIDTLGLDKDNCEYIEVPNPFPVENRPIVYNPQVNMSYKYQKNNTPKLLRLIDKTIDNHLSENGIIHTITNDMARTILDNSKHKDKMMIATGGTKEEVLQIFKNNGGIILSPSLDTGADFKYDEGRWQIICKLPFPSLADKQIKKRAQIDKKWYLMQMANKLVQMYGRTNRAPDDYSKTYIFDNRLGGYLNKDIFPNWFKEAIL
jgi:Rad3-related DNA helicase